jgi:hypothetical protein
MLDQFGRWNILLEGRWKICDGALCNVEWDSLQASCVKNLVELQYLDNEAKRCMELKELLAF